MADKVVFNFLTLNIWHGGLLTASLLPFLTSQHADVMVLQEVNENSDPSVAPHFRTTQVLHTLFPDHTLAYDAGIKLNYVQEHLAVEHGQATLSRYPILRHELVYFDSAFAVLDSPLPGGHPDYRSYPKYLQKTWLNIGGRELLVLNVHGVWDFHGDDTPARLSMSRTILTHAQKSEYVVIAGDSNARYQSQTISSLMSRYPSALTHVPSSTFNMHHKTDPGYARAAVDILLTSPNIRVLASSIPQVDVSDHLPIIATLEI